MWIFRKGLWIQSLKMRNEIHSSADKVEDKGYDERIVHNLFAWKRGMLTLRIA